MTNKEQTISNLKKLKSFHNGSYGAAINAAINALKHEQALGEAFNIAFLYGKEKGMEAIDKALYQMGMDGIKEQEIKALDEVSEYDKDHIWYKGHQYISLRRFLEVKAEAEQEPCEDAISRQAVIDTIEIWLSCDDYNEAERHIMRAMQSVLYDLPPVNPQEPIDYKAQYESFAKKAEIVISQLRADRDRLADVFDKIRAEIEKPLHDERCFDTADAKAQYIALNWCVEIIDKYKAESEDKDAKDSD